LLVEARTPARARAASSSIDFNQLVTDEDGGAVLPGAQRN
jgi:hypothetical protein